jgi:hypothetical protein
MTTDTPRTDAARFEALRSAALRQDCIPLKLGQELERELNASQAEVERLLDKLRLAVMLAEEVADEWVDPDYCDDSPEFIRLRSRINQIKETLNKNDK